MDKIINDANSEIEGLNQKLAGKCKSTGHKGVLTRHLAMQMEQDKIKTENATLVTAFREKTRKHQQTLELYDRLKRKEMAAVTQSAAFDSVDEVLGSIATQQGQNHQKFPLQPQSGARSDRQPVFYQPPAEMQNGVVRPRDSSSDQTHRHGRSTSNGSLEDGGTMPPPTQRVKESVHKAFESSRSLLFSKKS